MPVKVPCGRCIGCRLETSRVWAVRCLHEAQLHEDNCFVTLTYSDEYLPAFGSLSLRDMQLFFKRLRKKRGRFRYFHCGEYGDKNLRPHYHAILFGLDFDDKVLWKENNNNKYYISRELNELWAMGHCIIGDVTFESAAYVARYVMKKVTGDAAETHYQVVDPETGEVARREPEYVTQSRRPGIGAGWYEKFASDLEHDDFVVVRGKKMKVPKFYDKRREVSDPVQMKKFKRQRKKRAAGQAHDNTSDRLRVREKVQQARLKLLPRKLGDDE